MRCRERTLSRTARDGPGGAGARGGASRRGQLGNMSETGAERFGIERNAVNAVKYHTAAAGLGNPSSHAALGSYFETGTHGVKKSLEAACKHWEAAAALGNNLWAHQNLARVAFQQVGP